MKADERILRRHTHVHCGAPWFASESVAVTRLEAPAGKFLWIAQAECIVGAVDLASSCGDEMMIGCSTPRPSTACTMPSPSA